MKSIVKETLRSVTARSVILQNAPVSDASLPARERIAYALFAAVSVLVKTVSA